MSEIVVEICPSTPGAFTSATSAILFWTERIYADLRGMVVRDTRVCVRV